MGGYVMTETQSVGHDDKEAMIVMLYNYIVWIEWV